MLSTTRPTSLRFVGFLTTLLGGGLIALGSALTWARVTIGQIGTTNTFPPQDTKGLDTVEGKVTLALGLFALVAIPVMRLTMSRRGRRIWAGGIVIAGLVAGGLALADATRSFDRFSQSACDRLARDIADKTHFPFEPVLERCEKQTAQRTDVALKSGVYMVVVGGLLGAVGGVLGFVWAGRPTKPGTADPIDQGPVAQAP